MTLPPVDGTTSREDKDMWCKSCKVKHIASGAWFCKECCDKFCKECCDKFCKAMEGENRKMEDLEAGKEFLTTWIWNNDDRRSGCSVDLMFADVHLIIKASPDSPPPEVLANKFILASRSPVFKNMFELEMQESQTSIVNIEEVSYDALKAFVGFLYTAEADLDDQMAWDLLALAEKFEVMYLKSYCEKFMLSRLNWDNSVSYYAFAHQHHATALREAALSVFSENIDFVHEHQDFPELDAKLAVEIYTAHFTKQRCNIQKYFQLEE